MSEPTTPATGAETGTGTVTEPTAGAETTTPSTTEATTKTPLSLDAVLSQINSLDVE